VINFGEFESDEIPQIANFTFQYRNAALVKYTYMYTAAYVI